MCSMSQSYLTAGLFLEGQHPFPSCRPILGPLLGDTASSKPAKARGHPHWLPLSRAFSAAPSLGIQTGAPATAPGALLPLRAPH